MRNRIIRIVFVALFSAMLLVPLLNTNLQDGKVFENEKRKSAPMAKLRSEDGTINEDFTADFETWINDNIGLRSTMILDNALIQYKLFRVLANNSNMYLGPNGELNYATSAMLEDYQHANLFSEEELREIADGLQYMSDYVKSQDAKFYYYQCWDKHSIYPEYFPRTVIQTGTESRTDGMIQAFSEYTDVKVISPKKELIEEKPVKPTYSVWGDPSHWNPRGAYIAYLKLMDAINADSEKPYRVLQESDYTITMPDQGEVLFGGIHEVDYIEEFTINDPKAVLTNNKLTFLADDERHRYFTNDFADNDTRLLIIGDSYFQGYIVDDIAESFHETIMLWGNFLDDLQPIVEAYDPDIVVVEAAERINRSKSILRGVKRIKKSAGT